MLPLMKQLVSEANALETSIGLVASPATAAGPEIALALHATLVWFILRRRGRPARWAAPGFGRKVELVRSHLAPIQTPHTLAASFVRESCRTGDPWGAPAQVTRDLAMNPVHVAYALRWLEVTEVCVLPAWSVLLAARPRDANA